MPWALCGVASKTKAHGSRFLCYYSVTQTAAAHSITALWPEFSDSAEGVKGVDAEKDMWTASTLPGRSFPKGHSIHSSILH